MESGAGARCGKRPGWAGLCRTHLDFQGVKRVRIGQEFSSARAGWVQPAAQRSPSMGEALGWSPNMAIYGFFLEIRARNRWWKEGSEASQSCTAALRILQDLPPNPYPFRAQTLVYKTLVSLRVSPSILWPGVWSTKRRAAFLSRPVDFVQLAQPLPVHPRHTGTFWEGRADRIRGHVPILKRPTSPPHTKADALMVQFFI